MHLSISDSALSQEVISEDFPGASLIVTTSNGQSFTLTEDEGGLLVQGRAVNEAIFVSPIASNSFRIASMRRHRFTDYLATEHPEPV